MSSGSPDQLPQCFLNLNWDHSIDPSSQFGPALISFMSSQSSNSPAPGESFRFGKLGRGLQGVGNSSEEISPQPQFMRAPTNSSPIIDLSKLGHVHQHHQAMGELPFAGNPTLENLDQFPADPGFAERAARFSIFDSYRWLASHFELPGNGKPSTVASSQSLKASGLQIAHSESNSEVPVSNGLQLEMNNAELGKAREETSVSDPISASGEACLRDPRGSNAKKRKAHLKAKEKDTNLPKPAIDPPKVSDEEHCSAKTCQSVENNNGTGNDSAKSKSEQNDGVSTNGNGEQKQGKGSNAKPTEPPKDYIHVRARRGQATDSHSLAERVRREKISQRMKLLQDLVPGCSKVTGKAVMLDEIINYVQSLQRQVEFLSMKLATVNPHLDFNNLTNLLPKDMIQTCGPAPNPVYPFERSMTTSYANQTQQRNPLHYVATNGMDSHCSMNLLDPTFHQNLSAHQASLNGFGDGSSQLGAFWEDDLQSVVQMGIGHDQEIITSSQNFQGTFPTAQMKIEL